VKVEQQKNEKEVKKRGESRTAKNTDEKNLKIRWKLTAMPVMPARLATVAALCMKSSNVLARLT
jgi:hypothetical protein